MRKRRGHFPPPPDSFLRFRTQARSVLPILPKVDIQVLRLIMHHKTLILIRKGRMPVIQTYIRQILCGVGLLKMSENGFRKMFLLKVIGWKIFRKEYIDGQTLVTLERSHRACFGMSDFEWLLFKEARKRLLDGSERAGGTLEHLGMSPTAPEIENLLFTSSDLSQASSSHGALWPKSLWKLFNIPGFHWGSEISKDDQIELLSTEVQSLRGEIAIADERETSLHAQLEHLDELLRSAQLAGYLYTRTRWIALPGEPPIDDIDVDDWIQRFVVLQGSCIFFYLRSTDSSPQDSILLKEIVEAGRVPMRRDREDDEEWFSFYITSCHGVRFECSSPYKLQVDSWLTAIGVNRRS